MDAKANDVDGKVSNLGRKSQQANWHFGKRKKNKCWKEKSRKIGFKTLQINSMNKKKNIKNWNMTGKKTVSK